MKIYIVVWNNGQGWGDNAYEDRYYCLNENNAKHLQRELEEELEETKKEYPAIKEYYEIKEVETCD